MKRFLPGGSRLAMIILSLAMARGPLRAQTLPQDQGASGTWQKLLKLRTIASVMHTTAHPDDEDGGLLAWLGRKQGARVALLTLNRGEGGDNALGPELFDALGLIRTEELLRADAYYGVDRQYFTSVIDYGFSKRMDEAMEKWGHDELLRDVVRIIRRERPLVVVSRFQGNAQDGHGNHQAAGSITQEAFRVAGDPSVFPDQIAEGLRAWRPLKLYIGTGFFGGQGGATVRVDTGEYSPWLGYSYQDFARIGLSFQRSQNSGSLRLVPGPSFAAYRRLVTEGDAPEKEADFFEGIDTRVVGLFPALHRPAPPGASASLGAIDEQIQAAIGAFSITDPSACVPALARGLAHAREAIHQCEADADAVHLLRLKERQFMDAINAALGIAFTAVAQPSGQPEPTGRFAAFAPPPVMGPAVPGQSLDVKLNLTNRGRPEIQVQELGLRSSEGWKMSPLGDPPTKALADNQTATRRLVVEVPEDASPSRPYFSRSTVAENRYRIADRRALGLPAADPPLTAVASYSVEGVAVEVLETVRRREANLPYGHELRALEVVPRLAVNLTPRQSIIPQGDSATSRELKVELVHDAPGETEGELALTLPDGWSSEPATHHFRFSRPGERSITTFQVAIPKAETREYTIEAVARAGGREEREGYETIRHRDLPLRYLFHPAICRLRAIDVKIAPGLQVGYVMGVGDEVPASIAQLGAKVRLLDEQDLTSGDLTRFDTIMTGTRAYAVRQDLKRNNRRLLDYVKGGGNLVVLYNTPEFVPNQFAPFPAQLPGSAEEVSEEDAPVELLSPEDPVFRKPNRITASDFEGWVEQRGSKFLAGWDAAYTPMIASHDKGQASQQGGWVSARYGKGRYTYFAYALHRQLPYGVPGAYRLLANLLSLGKTDGD